MRPTFKALLASLLFTASSASAALIYDELDSGDLSNNYALPTIFEMGAGASTIIGSVSSGDRDLFTLRVPSGLQIDSITLLSYSTSAQRPNNTSYLLSMPGEMLSSPPSNGDFYPDPIGYVGFGSWAVGMDIMGFITFGAPYHDAPALGQGSYAFWINETGPRSGYSLEFNVSAIPEPSPIILSSLVALPILFLRRRRRRVDEAG